MIGFFKPTKAAAGGAMKVTHGNHVIDARKHFDEAFAALPYVNPRHKDMFANFFQQHWDSGMLERTMLKANLPSDFFVQFSGKSPAEAIKAITMRAFCRIVAEARKRDEAAMRKAGYFPYDQAVCDVNEAYCCAQAKSLQGKLAPLDKRTKFPLASCNAEWCNCQWMLMRGKKA